MFKCVQQLVRARSVKHVCKFVGQALKFMTQRERDQLDRSLYRVSHQEGNKLTFYVNIVNNLAIRLTLLMSLHQPDICNFVVLVPDNAVDCSIETACYCTYFVDKCTSM